MATNGTAPLSTVQYGKGKPKPSPRPAPSKKGGKK